MPDSRRDTWADGRPYEAYVGRWSRLVARQFVGWLDVAPGSRWLDVGCGTGALTGVILDLADPASVKGIDPSDGFTAFAREHARDPRATFARGSAEALPVDSAEYDAVAAGLALNFVSDPAAALSEFFRATRPGGVAGVYVWDYAGEMQMLRFFWDAAASLDEAAAELDEGARFAICQPDALTELFRGAGLAGVEVRAIDVPTVFASFDDYWTPFLGGQGSAPTYAASLTEEQLSTLRERLRRTLPITSDGSIHLVARAWAAKGWKSEG